MALQTSIACHMSMHKLQEAQKSSHVITDSEHVIKKSPYSSALDSVQLSPTNNNCSSNSNINNNNNTVITSSHSTPYSSNNPSVSLLSRNGGNLVRTFVMNGSLQSDTSCNKVSGLVNGPVSLLKDKQVCASSLTNPSQQNGEFRCSSNNSNNSHYNNNCNVKEDTNVVSAQCQKTCAGFGATVVHHSSNNNSTVNSNTSSNNSSANKSVGGTTNQIVTTKVVKPG